MTSSASGASASSREHKSESQILAEVLLALGRYPSVRAWRNNTGAARYGDTVVRYGLPGSADVIGLLAPSGRLLAVEVKTLVGRQSQQQRAFERMITTFGGLYLVVRSADDALAQLRERGYCTEGA